MKLILPRRHQHNRLSLSTTRIFPRSFSRRRGSLAPYSRLSLALLNSIQKDSRGPLRLPASGGDAVFGTTCETMTVQAALLTLCRWMTPSNLPTIASYVPSRSHCKTILSILKLRWYSETKRSMTQSWTASETEGIYRWRIRSNRARTVFTGLMNGRMTSQRWSPQPCISS